MKPNLIIAIFILLISSNSTGQTDSRCNFLSTKGHWILPVKNVKRIVKYEDYKKQDNHHGDNKSITFIAAENSAVKAVHDGHVVLINTYDDMWMVITRYDEYLLTYANLHQPTVKKGDWIKAGQVIGQMAKGLDDTFELELGLFDGADDLDPADWFSKTELRR